MARSESLLATALKLLLTTIYWYTIQCDATYTYMYFEWSFWIINCMCMGRFDASGTSKNDNLLKVLVGHGVKKYGIRIFFRGLQAEIWLFVYIL